MTSWIGSVSRRTRWWPETDFISERYDLEDTITDGFRVIAFKRDIGENTYLFIVVKNDDGPALITVSIIEAITVHRIYNGREGN